MVLIRIRPPLEHEYGKEIVASVDEDVTFSHTSNHKNSQHTSKEQDNLD